LGVSSLDLGRLPGGLFFDLFPERGMLH